jgi:hypothetical protein
VKARRAARKKGAPTKPAKEPRSSDHQLKPSFSVADAVNYIMFRVDAHLEEAGEEYRNPLLNELIDRLNERKK